MAWEYWFKSTKFYQFRFFFSSKVFDKVVIFKKFLIFVNWLFKSSSSVHHRKLLYPASFFTFIYSACWHYLSALVILQWLKWAYLSWNNRNLSEKLNLIQWAPSSGRRVQPVIRIIFDCMMWTFNLWIFKCKLWQNERFLGFGASISYIVLKLFFHLPYQTLQYLA